MLFNRFKEVLKKDGLLVSAFFGYRYIARHIRPGKRNPYEGWIREHEKDI